MNYTPVLWAAPASPEWDMVEEWRAWDLKARGLSLMNLSFSIYEMGITKTCLSKCFARTGGEGIAEFSY